MATSRLTTMVPRHFNRSCFYLIERSIHKSVPLFAGKKWRERNGKAPNGNEFGPLTDYPDWSYADGRAGLLGKGQKRRLVEQEGYARKVVQLLKEVDFAVEREANLKKDAEEQHQKLLEKKLKPKGNVYMTQNPS
ncbi:39S ribosomal protein L52, mitochondrial-like [Limulus polyphemus]|uniref:Large ribosomal subunit protein mL52 n=1 Tax=Limulus polyphemus TaxID=6850 RepID=A0ABM1BYQ5_LIMPO|nr:39S ribosomal protein L52, mitochondrial-like [Limulus polyphemus]